MPDPSPEIPRRVPAIIQAPWRQNLTREFTGYRLTKAAREMFEGRDQASHPAGADVVGGVDGS